MLSKFSRRIVSIVILILIVIRILVWVVIKLVYFCYCNIGNQLKYVENKLCIQKDLKLVI